MVGKGGDNERIQEYRPSQEEREQIEKINILIQSLFSLLRNIGDNSTQENSRECERILVEPRLRQQEPSKPTQKGKVTNHCVTETLKTRKRQLHPAKADSKAEHIARCPKQKNIRSDKKS